MGMRVYFTQVTPTVLTHIIANPWLIDEVYNSRLPELNLDKAWQGIHFLLTDKADGDNSVFSKAIYGGKLLSQPDFDPDFYYYLTPAEVVEIAKALTAISPDDLKAKYSPVAMNEAQIYPHIWDRAEAEILDYLLGYYVQLVAFYQTAAQEGNALLVNIN
jgi:hypothetical protein